MIDILCLDTFHDMQKASDGRSISPRFADQGCSGACPERRPARNDSHLGPAVPHDRRIDCATPRHGPRDGDFLHITGTTARLRRLRKALKIGNDICGRSCLGSSPPRFRLFYVSAIVPTRPRTSACASLFPWRVEAPKGPGFAQPRSPWWRAFDADIHSRINWLIDDRALTSVCVERLRLESLQMGADTAAMIDYNARAHCTF